MKRLIIPVFVLMLTASAAFAQDGGQLWVNAFEDRDGDAVRDPNEPFFTRGISVNLLDADGVIVASALLDDSPNASRGLIGFQRLSPGTYTVEVISPDFTPTTPTTFTQTVELDVLPTVLWFGAQRVSAAAEASTQPAITDDGEIMRLAIALMGAVIVVGVFSVIGLVVYLVVFAPRAPKMTKISTSTTGSMRPVRANETGEVRKTRG